MNLVARALSVLFLAAFVPGCFSEVPELGDFKLSASEVNRGDTVTGTAMVDDGDSDMNGGKMFVTVSAGGSAIDTRELPIAIGADAAKVGVSLSLQISPLAPKGDVTVELKVQDKAGHMSNAVSAPLKIN